MFVSSTVAAMLLGASLAVAAASLVLIVRRASDEAVAVPGAAVVERRARLRRALPPWLPVAMLAAGLGGAWWLRAHAHAVVVVTDGAGGLRVDRLVRLGGDDDRTSIVNRSSRPVRVEVAQYGGGLRFGAPIRLRPGEEGHVARVDFVGPDARPPDALESDSALAVEVRYWLTWDR